MSTARAIAVLVACTLGGCLSGTGERVTYSEDRLSVEKIEGWTAKHERNALLFSDPESRTTIAIRVAELTKRQPGDLTQLSANTKIVLASLPSSKVAGPMPLEHPEMAGALFELSFVPPGRTEMYVRWHAVLVGRRHFYHAMITAPQADVTSATDLFFETVSSLREE